MPSPYMKKLKSKGGTEIFTKIAYRFVKETLFLIRRIDMAVSVELAVLTRPFRRRPRIFNLDLHTSLIEDLKVGLAEFDVKLVSWSVSGNNRNFRKFYKIPDPVKGIYGKSWLELQRADFDIFREKYNRYLRTFDGFIVCFPPAFAEIFVEFDKPILVYFGTRYEAPFTNSADDWDFLNSVLTSGQKTGQINFVTNNLADLNYYKYFTESTAAYLPSLCDYTKAEWVQGGNQKVIFSRDERIAAEVSLKTDCDWLSPQMAFGKAYSWKKLSQVEEVLVIPYNISTMTLFELATLGIPVSIPSAQFLETLRLRFEGILSELSFFTVLQLSLEELDEANPNRIDLKEIREWWTRYADFYNAELMPNVRLIDSFEDLSTPHPFLLLPFPETRETITGRNSRLKAQRFSILQNFVSDITDISVNDNYTR